MRMSGSRLRPTRLATLLACLAVAVPVIFTASAASADTGTISQSSPTQGGTLVGTAFSDQLQVSGATGTVTYVQTDGSASVTVSSSGQVSAPASLSAGSYTADGTDSDANGDTGTWTYTVNVLQPAPSGFTTTVVNVYQSEYTVAQQLGQGSALPTISNYQQKVSDLTPLQLAGLYNAVQENPEWYQIPSLMQTVSSGIPATGSPSASRLPSASRFSSTSRSPASRSRSAKSVLRGVSAGGNLQPVQRYSLPDCGSEPTDAAIFALQIVIDVTSLVYNIAAVDTAIPGAGLVVIAVAEVAATVVSAFTIAHDTLAYQQQVYNDCSSNGEANEVDNIDNTTYQTYTLLTTVASSVTQLQTTDNTTQQDVQNVQSGLVSLQTNLGQSITNDTQALQTTVGSDTQGLTSQLQTDLNGLQQDLTVIEGDESTLSQDVGQLSNGTTTIQSALASDLSKILSETDNDAAQLTALVNQNDQQILNTLKSNFSTQQSEYEANLKLDIEHGLAEWGSRVPQVQFMLPASQGGYLNSTPVGVKEVVTDDLSALQAMGVKITAAALNSFNAANAALAAGQYVTAYQDYAVAYEDFA
jgi:hypothetical protein